MALEKKFDIDYPDEEIEQLTTIEDVIALTISKVSSHYDPEQIKQQIYKATAEVGEYTSSQLHSKMSLIDALCRTPEK